MFKRKDGDSPVTALSVDFLQVTDVRDLRANADWWGIAASAANATERRYLRYRAYQQTDVLSVDDTTARLHEPPANASWYIAAIMMGRSYETVVSGSTSTFTAGVEAKLARWGVDVAALAQSNQLQVTVKARGIAADTDKAIFAQSADQIMSAYKQDTPVPIYVVYRHISGRQVRPSVPVEWVPDDDVKVEQAAVQCYCTDNAEIAISCRVHNNGGRSMDVTVTAQGLTATTNSKADGVGRVRLAARHTGDMTIVAPIHRSFGANCSSAVDCSCVGTDTNPSQ